MTAERLVAALRSLSRDLFRDAPLESFCGCRFVGESMSKLFADELDEGRRRLEAVGGRERLDVGLVSGQSETVVATG